MAGRRGGPDRQKLDRLLQAKCHGEAWRRADAGEAIELIVGEVRDLAGERSHVLVEIAGVGIGAWSVRPSLPATELLVAGILLGAAGANSLDDLRHWIAVGQERAAQRAYTAP